MTGTQALDRAIRLVRLAVEAEAGPTHGELVAASGLPRSTVSRVLGALERGGLLERTAGGGYRGGSLFVDYAMRFDRSAALAGVARVHLEKVARETGESVNLAVPRGSEVVQVDQVDARFLLQSDSWVGVGVPKHCSALGKVLMAWDAVPPPVGRLESRTERSVPTHAELEAELEVVRERGWAVTSGELEEGLDGVAVPVIGVDAEDDADVVAALGVSGPTFRIGERHAELARTLLVASTAITRDLVGRRRARIR